jgi:hypothetical protein
MPTPITTQRAQQSAPLASSNTPTPAIGKNEIADLTLIAKSDRAEVKNSYSASLGATTDYILRGVRDFFGKPDDVRSAQANISAETYLQITDDTVKDIEFISPSTLNNLLQSVKGQFANDQATARSTQANISAFDYMALVAS